MLNCSSLLPFLEPAWAEQLSLYNCLDLFIIPYYLTGFLLKLSVFFGQHVILDCSLKNQYNLRWWDTVIQIFLHGMESLRTKKPLRLSTFRMDPSLQSISQENLPHKAASPSPNAAQGAKGNSEAFNSKTREGRAKEWQKHWSFIFKQSAWKTVRII